MRSYPVLDPVSQAYPEVQGRSPTCYSPVRHSSTQASLGLSVRLACVKHAASVHPEPGSNSPQNVSTKPVKQAVKSPKPNQKTNQTNTTTTTTAAAASDLAKNPKITKVQQPTPTRQGKNGGQQKTRENQPTRAHQTKQQHDPSMDSTTPPPAHTQTNTKDAKHSAHKAGKQPTQQKYIGTLSSSQTTPAHPNQPTQREPATSDFGIRQRSFSCPPHKPGESHSPAGRCRSR